MVNLDEFYMRSCIDEAWKYQGLTYPNPAVGAAVVKNGRLLSIAAHQEAGGPHAEVLAIKEAYYRLTQDRNILSITKSLHLHNYLLKYAGDLFSDATIYVTLEPCFHYGKTPPCTMLLKDLGFERVVIGTHDPNPKASGGAKYLRSKGIVVDMGIEEKEAATLIAPFIKWSKSRFIFFKLAQSFNGGIRGGIISSFGSREYVHRLRDKIDLLVIGGNTVRTDRPLLDARLVQGRAPDVLIYSKKRNFDRRIPLFGVEKREVFIEDSFERIKDYRYVMIEGGEGMLKATRALADWYLFFVNPSLFSQENYKIDKKLTLLHMRKIDKDIMIWSANG